MHSHISVRFRGASEEAEADVRFRGASAEAEADGGAFLQISESSGSFQQFPEIVQNLYFDPFS